MLRRRTYSTWMFGVCLLAAFTGGFGLSFFSRPATSSAELKSLVTDFHIVIPEGETLVTVFSSVGEVKELGRLRLQRDGETIAGIARAERRIAARDELTETDAAFFRRELSGVFMATDSPWQRANKIRTWLSEGRHRLALPGLATRVPREAYEQMKEGNPVLCGNLAEIYVGLAQAAGLTARTVGLSVLVQNGMFGADTHVGAEVWLSEKGGWVYEDPTFDCYWEIDGEPASALALHDALMDGRQINFGPQDERTRKKLLDYYLDPRLYFRHLSYEYKAGGALLYFADKRLEPISLTDKNWIQTNERVDIQRLDIGGNIVVERRMQIAPGIFAQLLGHDLFIRDRREERRGLRVRSSSGTVEGCAYIHARADDLGLFSGVNLARNPSFHLTRKSDEIADEWSVAGPVEAMTVAGGQAMAALAGGKLWQRVKVRPHRRYLFYARVSVARGLVNWTFGDSSRTAKSMGTIEPERISEVVSDVVESETGYLDVVFEVPSGGAFRVVDVIITESPRFTTDDHSSLVGVKREAAPLR
jgi:Transglutaminase-like superfamily